MGASLVGLALVLILSQLAQSAPVAEDGTELQEQDSYPSEGCYYNFEHYEEGDRIVTNEPCLNCTCHNHMLMCYLRVCPFTKAIGQDCTVEKRPDQCCPIITCPEVPVQLLTSSTTKKPTIISTAVGRPDNYGCTLSDNTFYPDGAQVPSDSRKPCELCYCIRNRTACVMQECTLQVEGCQPVYQQGVCCPVRYDCDYDSVTTPGTTMGLITTPGGPTQCLHDGVVYNDGEMVEFQGKSPCEHCYCMRGDVVCAVQECGTPLQAPDCVPLPPPPGHCCPDTFQCANGTVPLESLLGKPESQDDSHSSEVHSGEIGHSNELANDNAAEGSESSEEQKKPQEESSTNDSSSSSQNTQNKGEDSSSEDTHTPASSDEKTTEKPLTVTPAQQITQEDNISNNAVETDNHEIEESDKAPDHKKTQNNEETPELTEKNPEEEHNIIYGENESKPVGELSPESLVHDGSETNKNPESQITTEENQQDSTKPDEDAPEHGSTDKENDTGILTEAGNTENNDLIVDQPLPEQIPDNIHKENDFTTTPHTDETKKPEHDTEGVSQHFGENPEHISLDTPVKHDEDSSDTTHPHPITADQQEGSNQSDSEETMVTGDEAEDNKQTTVYEGENKDQLNNDHKESSITEHSHYEDMAHSTESADILLSSSTTEKQSVDAQDDSDSDQEMTQMSESESEKNRIHGVTPETYTEVSVETVEVHTSTPEINHPQDGPTSQSSLIDDSPLSTEGPSASHEDSHTQDPSYQKPEDHSEFTTVITNHASDDHDVTTVLDTGNVARVPGEGNCIIDGQTYKHDSDVHTSNACQVSCKCLNSIVHCKLVECPPAPTQYANCMPLQEPDSCCPSYTCDDKPSQPLESHSQVSTEYPEGTEQEESSHPESQDGYQDVSHAPSDHEVPSHDQAHSSSEGFEPSSDEDKKPSETPEVIDESSSHDLSDVPNKVIEKGTEDETEHKPSSESEAENDENNTHVITNSPSNIHSDGLEKPEASNDVAENAVESQPSTDIQDDIHGATEGTGLAGSESDQVQGHDQDVSTDEAAVPPQDDNTEILHQSTEGVPESHYNMEEESTLPTQHKPESADKEHDIGISSAEHNDFKPISLDENKEHDTSEEHGSDSVISHLPEYTIAPSQPEFSDKPEEKYPSFGESLANESEVQSGQTSSHKDEEVEEQAQHNPELDGAGIENSVVSEGNDKDHFSDQAVLNQIANNEVIHQAHPTSDQSSESETNTGEGENEGTNVESENKPVETQPSDNSANDENIVSSNTPEGLHDNAANDVNENHVSGSQESTEPQTSNENEPVQHTENGSTENGSEVPLEHPETEVEHTDNESNEINHDNGIVSQPATQTNKDGSEISQEPEKHFNNDSIDNTISGGHSATSQEEVPTSDDSSHATSDSNEESSVAEEHPNETVSQETADNVAHNEVGSEGPLHPELNISIDSQNEQDTASEQNTGNEESGSNETVDNNESTSHEEKPHADYEDITNENEQENETLEPNFQSSHEDNSDTAQPDSTPTEEENIVNPLSVDETASINSEHENNEEVGSPVSESDITTHDSHTPQDNLISIQDGVGGIVQHETPNEIEPIFVGEHPSIHVEENEPTGNQDDAITHHTEPAVEENVEEQQTHSSPSDSEKEHDVPELNGSSEEHQAVSDSNNDEGHQITPTGEESNQETPASSEVEESHEGPSESEGSEPHTSLESESVHLGETAEENQQNVPSSSEHDESHHDETVSNEIVEGSHDLPISSEAEGSHDVSEATGESNQDLSASSEGVEDHNAPSSGETEDNHQTDSEASDNGVEHNQNESGAVSNEDGQHESTSVEIDHHDDKPASSEIEEHESIPSSHEDTEGHQEVAPPSVSEENSHESGSSEVTQGMYDTSSSTDTSMEHEHPSESEAHHDAPTSQESSLEEHFSSGEDGNEPSNPSYIPAGQSPSEVENEEVNLSHAPEEQSPLHAPEEQSPSQAPEEQSPSHAPEEQSPSHAPEEQSPSHAPEEQSPSHAPEEQSPSGEVENDHVSPSHAPEEQSSSSSGEVENEHLNPSNYPGEQNPPSSGEVGNDQLHPSYVPEGQTPSSGEVESEQSNPSNVPEEHSISSEETNKEPLSEENGPHDADTPVEHHELPGYPQVEESGIGKPFESSDGNENGQSQDAVLSTDSNQPDKDVTGDQIVHYSPEDQSHHEDPVTEEHEHQGDKTHVDDGVTADTWNNNDGDEQGSNYEGLPESSSIPEHSAETAVGDNEMENAPVHEITHHEDNIKPDLTAADHHIEHSEHSTEQSSPIDSEPIGKPSDKESTSPSQNKDDHESSESEHTLPLDSTNDHADDAVESGIEQGTSDGGSSPENEQASGSDGIHGSEQGDIQHEPIGHTNEVGDSQTVDELSYAPSPDYDHSEPISPSVAESEPGSEEQKINEETHSDVPESENSLPSGTSPEVPSTNVVNEDSLPTDLNEGFNQESSSHETGPTDYTEGSDPAFPAEEHGSSATGLTDSDAVIDAVYALVHQQEGSNDVGDTNKPPGQDVDIPSSEISSHEEPNVNQEIETTGEHETPASTQTDTGESLFGEHHDGQEQGSKQPIQHVPEESGSEHEQGLDSELGHEHLEYPSETLPEHPSESQPEHPSGLYPEHPSEILPEQPSEPQPEHPYEAHPEHVSESHSQQPSELYPDHPSMSHPENPSQTYPEQPPVPHPEHTFVPEDSLQPHVEHPSESYPEHSSIPHVEHPSELYPDHPSMSHPENPSQTYPEQPPVPHPEHTSVPEDSLQPHVEHPSIPHVEHPSESYPERPSVSHLEHPSEQHSEQPSDPEVEQPTQEHSLEESTHGHNEHPLIMDPQSEGDHTPEGVEQSQPEEIGSITPASDKDSAQPNVSQYEEVPVTEKDSSSSNVSEVPVHHIPESGEKHEEKPPGPSYQAESSTENAFTTVMHEIFGSTNVATPDGQHQVQENEFFQPGGPLFQNWSQKPMEHVTTTKQPQTVPSLPEQEPYDPEPDYEEEDANYSPGTCRYGGKVYLSAQQIPRDDPCDFCFCFRSDIICLQQSCPPPIQNCYQENIPGFCCPRYECHVSMATMVNVTTTTTTTTTTLPPHFLAHAYKGAAKKTGCQVKGVAYRVGERIPSTSGPCLECRCGADGQMKCDPTVCNPQETLLRQVMDAAVISRRRRHIMTTPYFTARRLR